MTAPPAFSISVLHGLGALTAMAEGWDGLVRDTGADLFFDRRWLEVWWRHFASRRQFCALTIQDGARLVGFLPLAIGRVWFGPLPVRMARLAGPIPYFAVLTPPIRPDDSDAVCAALAADLEPLLSRLGADMICLPTLSAASPLAENLRRAFSEGRSGSTCTADASAPHALFRLAESLEAYLGRLSRKRRTKLRKSRAEILAMGITTDTLSGPSAAAFFPGFVDRHDQQWQAQGRQGHFGDWPRNRPFFHDLCEVFAGTGEARFYLQRSLAGEILAAQFCFVFGRTCLALLAARDISAETSELSIGQHAQMERLERLISEGIRFIDSGQGEYEHKISLGAEMVPTQSLILSRQGRVARFRLTFIRYWSRLVNLLYYRLWFLKLAPRVRQRFGLKPRPLWRHWIRTRL